MTALFFAPFLVVVPVWGQTTSDTSVDGQALWDRATEALQYQRNDEAIPLLRLVATQEPGRRAEALRLLAYALEREGQIAESETTLREALADDSLTAAEHGKIAFDLASFLRRHGRLKESEDMYTVAVGEDGSIAPAYLNRANLRVENGAYRDAIDDYELYLALRPRSEQRPQIVQMINLLREEIETEAIRQAEEERRREEEAQARRLAEQERREREEAERKAAEERRQFMLDSVLDSLEQAEEETESFRLEYEDIGEYEEDIDIVD